MLYGEDVQYAHGQQHAAPVLTLPRNWHWASCTLVQGTPTYGVPYSNLVSSPGGEEPADRFLDLSFLGGSTLGRTQGTAEGKDVMAPRHRVP